MHVSGCPCNWSGGQYAKCECEHWRQIHAMNENTAALEAHRRTMEEHADKDSRIAALEAQVKALTAERDAQVWIAKLAYAERDVARGLHAEACKERDAQAEAVKSACRMAYRASYLGFDRAWVDSQISGIQNKIVRETMQDIARAAVEKGGGQ